MNNQVNENKEIIRNQEKIFNMLNKLDAGAIKIDMIEAISRSMNRIEEYMFSQYIEQNIPKVGEVFADGEPIKKVLSDIYEDIDSIYIGIDLNMSEMNKKIEEINDEIVKLKTLKKTVENLEMKVKKQNK